MTRFNIIGGIVILPVLTWLWLVRKSPHLPQSFARQPPVLPYVLRNARDWRMNNDLSSAKEIPLNPPLVSAETAIVRESDCQVFATDARGLIWALASNKSMFYPHVVTGGTLLGGAHDPTTGALYVCDSTRGLLRVPSDPSKAHVEIVSPALSSDPLDEITYCDDVHVTSDGKVYFTSASKLIPQRDMHARFALTFSTFVADYMLGSPTGRVFKYDPDRRETTQIADGLAFANGIAVDPSGDYALVVETNRARVTKLFLRGDKCGEMKTLLELPGLPDGISYDSVSNVFWLTLYVPILPAARLVPKLPVFIRRLLIDIPPHIISPHKPASVVAAIAGETGEVLAQYGDPSKRLGMVAAAHRCGKSLWLGILHGRTIAEFDIPETFSKQ